MLWYRMKLRAFIFIMLVLQLSTLCEGWCEGPARTLRKIIVITDLEPDDRLALHLLASHFAPEEILLVGAVVMNSAQKKILTQRLLSQIGYASVPVEQGSGGFPEDYDNFQATKPARTYPKEGVGILDEATLASQDQAPRANMDLQNHIERLLSEQDGIEFLVIAPPTDLVAVLNRRPDLRSKVGHIWMMGGWNETIDANGEKVLWSTYNWDMDFLDGNSNTKQLMTMEEIPMTIFSFHAIKKAFPERSIHPGNFLWIWKCIDRAKTQLVSLRETLRAMKSWNRHILKSLPALLPKTHALKSALLTYLGRQFTPADLLVVAAMIQPKMITESQPVTIQLDYQNRNLVAGIRVHVNFNPLSKIRVVEAIDAPLFGRWAGNSFQKLSRRLKPKKPKIMPSCAAYFI